MNVVTKIAIMPPLLVSKRWCGLAGLGATAVGCRPGVLQVEQA